jgi:hypothetical protein
MYTCITGLAPKSIYGTLAAILSLLPFSHAKVEFMLKSSGFGE